LMVEAALAHGARPPAAGLHRRRARGAARGGPAAAVSAGQPGGDDRPDAADDREQRRARPPRPPLPAPKRPQAQTHRRRPRHHPREVETVQSLEPLSAAKNLLSLPGMTRDPSDYLRPRMTTVHFC